MEENRENPPVNNEVPGKEGGKGLLERSMEYQRAASSADSSADTQAQKPVPENTAPQEARNILDDRSYEERAPYSREYDDRREDRPDNRCDDRYDDRRDARCDDRQNDRYDDRYDRRHDDRYRRRYDDRYDDDYDDYDYQERPRRSRKRAGRRGRRSGGIFVKLVIILLLLIALVFGGLFVYKTFFVREVTVNSTTLYSQIEKVAELTVIKNHYETLLSVSLGGGMNSPDKKSTSLFDVYELVRIKGVIRVGIKDLSSLQVEVNPDGTSVTIAMPHTEVLDNTILEQSVQGKGGGFSWIRVKTQDVFDGIQKEMANKVEEFKEMGSLDDADEQLKSVVTGIAASFGIENIEFKWVNAQTGALED